MSCCGRQTSHFAAPAAPRHPASQPPAAPRPVERTRYAQAFFEYTGTTGLSVTGPVSGKRYRFERTGARLAVDPVDKPALERVPNLRRMLGPA